MTASPRVPAPAEFIARLDAAPTLATETYRTRHHEITGNLIDYGAAMGWRTGPDGPDLRVRLAIDAHTIAEVVDPQRPAPAPWLRRPHWLPRRMSKADVNAAAAHIVARLFPTT